MNDYNDLYQVIKDGSLQSARVVVPKIHTLFYPQNVIDFGCGEGWWLSVFAEFGCEVFGVDGHHVDTTKLSIPVESFVHHDLSVQFHGNEHGLSKFDLAISLEVAEHLPESSADTFVDTLTSASNVIVFSAAIPGQGGMGHVNEQWPSYWAQKFSERGYTVSGFLRYEIWDDDRVENWYRQNLLIAINNQCPQMLGRHYQMGLDSPPRSLVHPVLWEHRKAVGF